MIENESLRNILLYATDLSIVCEVYPNDATPTEDGFDPDDALECFAAVGEENPITYRGKQYKRLVTKFGNPTRTIRKEKKAMTVDFSNGTREVANFEFNGGGFEGLILVVRVISRSLSVELSDSQIYFTGQCEKPRKGNKKSIAVTANPILHSRKVTFPRRRFVPEDPKGRVPSDPEFEGFIFMPQYGTVSFTRTEKKGGFMGWWNKKDVRKTMQYSSYSDMEASKSLPECLGRVQIVGVLIGALDAGFNIHMRVAACEGEIEAITNIRSANPNFPVDPSETIFRGLVGTANLPDEPIWVSPGFYSRTAGLRLACIGSEIDVNDEAPDIIMVIWGRKMMTPNTTDRDWDEFVWSNNGSAHLYWAMTDPDYYNLHTNWIEKAAAVETFDFNAQQIFNMSLSDFIFAEAG